MINLKQILVPVAVVAVGVLGAFATQMSVSNDVALQTLKPGWTDSPEPCTENQKMCSISGPNVCTVMLAGIPHQVRGKINPNDKTCPQGLYQFD